MSAGKVLLISAAGLGLVAVLVAVAKASSSSAPSSGTLPANFKPPPGSRVNQLPAGGAIPFPITKTSWDVAADASGAQTGTYTLVQRTASPNTDWLVTFTAPGGTSSGVVSYSQTPNGGLLAQAAAAGM